MGKTLALPLGTARIFNKRNPDGVRAVTLITAHEDVAKDKSESWSAADIQDIRQDVTYLTAKIRRREITIVVMESS